MVNRIAVLSICLLAAACAAVPPQPSDARLAQCLDLYARLDRAVAQQGVTPSSPVAIAGFPYLRTNRFLASLREQTGDAGRRKAWLERLAELDQEARQVELAALPQTVRNDLTAPNAAPVSDLLAACSKDLQAYDLANPDRLGLLQERAVVPDDYCTLNQILGVYPLTALPVQSGIARWHEEAHHLFALPLAAVPVRGELQRLRPPSEATVNTVAYSALPRDELGIPQLNPAQLAALFAAHTPVWEIDVAGDFDRPGAPYWKADGMPSVDTREPVVYRYASFTRWQGQVLLQLNYVIWFAERPLTGTFDILGGALDGLVWRVTLDPAGNPLIYDSIHNCGCYQQYFPTAALRLRPETLTWPEPPLVPQPAPSVTAHERLVIRVASATHYIQRVYAQRVYADAPGGSPYAWRAYHELYAVSAPGQTRRSLFDPKGLVPGTERRERWLLWPMGVPSAGAMRERGHHAIAFVGRRHFDDADLLDRLFEPTPSSQQPGSTR